MNLNDKPNQTKRLETCYFKTAISESITMHYDKNDRNYFKITTKNKLLTTKKYHKFVNFSKKMYV